MIARFALATELFDRIHRWVDLPPQSSFRFLKIRNNFVEPDVANHQEIDVTRSVVLVPGDRTVDKRQADAICQGQQRFLDHVVNPHRFGENALKLAKDRAIVIRLVVNLVPATDSAHNSGVRQLLEFPLCSSNRSACLSDQIPQIEFLIGTSVEEHENCSSCLSKEDMRESGGRRYCTHFGYNCILFEYNQH